MNIIELTNSQYFEKNAGFLDAVESGLNAISNNRFVNHFRDAASTSILGQGFQPFKVPLSVSFNPALTQNPIRFLNPKSILYSGVRDIRDQAMSNVWATGAAGLGAGVAVGALNGGVIGYHRGRSHTAHHNH